MIIKKIVVGTLENNCYIIGDERTREVFIVDPGDEPDRILDFVNEDNLETKFIVCTHAHFDHVGAINEIREITKAKIILHKDDLILYKNIEMQGLAWGFDIEPLTEPDIIVSEGYNIEIGDLRFTVLHTPGHSPGSICLYGEGILITGDTIFAGSVGRTDLYGGDINQLRKSFKRLIELPDNTIILPGHGPESTIMKEKNDNFFM
ncbi:MAG: MBL fold metallo-hydrolase [Nitrospirae bacterium]|nr:MBL fold metallo-hydrolase [Nitrospirota bacterium]